MTSRDVVNVVQYRLRSKRRQRMEDNPELGKLPKIKVGHCGTLDPLAEGVLVLGVGPAVRLVPYVQQQPKHYIGQFRLGASSATGDLENGFQEHADLAFPTRGQLEEACRRLTGQIDQVPPAYSAIWVDGQRAYDRVRRGEAVDMPSRQVMIHDLKLTEYDFPMMELDIVCGSGTYIRTLGIDVARAVGSIAVMTHLLRTKIGGFGVQSAVGIETLRDDPLDAILQPASMAINHLPKIVVDADDVARLRNGLCIAADASQDDALGLNAHVAAVSQDGELCAIITQKDRGWCPYRVFPGTVSS